MSEKKDGKSWLRRTLADLRGRDEDGDVIIGYVEEGADRVAIGKDIIQSEGDTARAGTGERRIAIGKNIIQIGTLVVPTVPVLAALGVVVSALIFVAVNFMGPAEMPGDFNIAVAEIGEMDAEGRVRPSEDGELLSRWIFNELVAANEAYGDSNLVIWHDSLSLLDKRVKLGTISGQTPEARAEAAAELAKRVEADVVVYGHLTPHNSPAELVLEFNVQPSLRAEANVTIGRYQLGEPIPVSANFSTDTLAKEALSSRVTGRAEALFWLLLGLRDDLLGDSEQALETFLRAEEELGHWKEEPEGGSEILYFFIGRSALFLKKYEEAEAALQEALRIDPTYARAKIVLAGVDFRRVQDLLHPPGGQSFQPEDVEQAIAGAERAILVYQEGLELARESHEPLVEMIARLTLASAYRLEGEIYFWLQDDAEANRFFDLAIEEAKVVLAPLEKAEQYRILAQAHLYLGAAYTQQAEILRKEGDVEGSRALYEKAQGAYATCIAQAEEGKAPHDDILKSKIIANSCQPWSEYVEEVLLTLP